MLKILKLLILLNIFLCVNLFASKSLYLSYNKIPTNIYKNQKFEVVVKALITTNDFDSLATTFSNSSNITILNPKNPFLSIVEYLSYIEYQQHKNNSLLYPLVF